MQLHCNPFKNQFFFLAQADFTARFPFPRPIWSVNRLHRCYLCKYGFHIHRTAPKYFGNRVISVCTYYTCWFARLVSLTNFQSGSPVSFQIAPQFSPTVYVLATCLSIAWSRRSRLRRSVKDHLQFNRLIFLHVVRLHHIEIKANNLNLIRMNVSYFLYKLDGHRPTKMTLESVRRWRLQLKFTQIQDLKSIAEEN